MATYKYAFKYKQHNICTEQISQSKCSRKWNNNGIMPEFHRIVYFIIKYTQLHKDKFV